MNELVQQGQGEQRDERIGPKEKKIFTFQYSYFQAHLNIARNAQDRAGMGRAFGNIGNAYSASGFFEQVRKILYRSLQLLILNN